MGSVSRLSYLSRTCIFSLLTFSLSDLFSSDFLLGCAFPSVHIVGSLTSKLASINLSISSCLFIYISVCLSACLSIYLSIFFLFFLSLSLSFPLTTYFELFVYYAYMTFPGQPGCSVLTVAHVLIPAALGGSEKRLLHEGCSTSNAR